MSPIIKFQYMAKIKQERETENSKIGNMLKILNTVVREILCKK